jgi:hypothetical protein
VPFSQQEQSLPSTAAVDLKTRRVNISNMRLTSFIPHNLTIIEAVCGTAFTHKHPAQFIVEVGLSGLLAIFF